jgi:transcriptional regulator with XRE-family HTH domain
MYQKIKDLCKKNNISVYHLEKELGLSTGSVCKWKKSIPRADTLSKVANYFGVSINYFLDSLI